MQNFYGNWLSYKLSYLAVILFIFIYNYFFLFSKNESRQIPITWFIAKWLRTSLDNKYKNTENRFSNWYELKLNTCEKYLPEVQAKAIIWTEFKNANLCLRLNKTNRCHVASVFLVLVWRIDCLHHSPPFKFTFLHLP